MKRFSRSILSSLRHKFVTSRIKFSNFANSTIKLIVCYFLQRDVQTLYLVRNFRITSKTRRYCVDYEFSCSISILLLFENKKKPKWLQPFLRPRLGNGSTFKADYLCKRSSRLKRSFQRLMFFSFQRQ